MDDQARRKRIRTTQPFVDSVLQSFGLSIVPIGHNARGRPQSKCSLCSKIMVNDTRCWGRHSRTCPRLREGAVASAANLQAAMAYGGEAHRKSLVDALVTTFWKHKLPFTHGVHVKEVYYPS